MYLNCHTQYSLRYGILTEHELLALAQASGARRVALTDINNTSACLNFVRVAPRYEVEPVLGIDFRNGARQLYVGLAENNAGFHALNAFLSHHLHDEIPLPEEAPSLDHVFFIYPFHQALLINRQIFDDREFIGIGIRDLRKLAFSKLSGLKDRLVALNAFTFRDKRDFNTHRLLRAIDNNTLLSKLPEEEQGDERDRYLSIKELRTHYNDWPFIIDNTHRLLKRCSIYFDFSATKDHQNKRVYSSSAEEDRRLLHELCKKGLPYRYKNVTKEIRARLKKELALIEKMEYIPFFLTNWDIVHYAKSKGYYHVGRGSGANSIVAYLLGITDVDPIDLDLYFERFMNLYRANPPDFDIDFSWRDREDVTRYIFERFGKNGQTALLATYNTFQHSAAVREMGKVFGLPKHEIDVLSDGKFSVKALDKLSKLVLYYAQRIKGMVNYLSIHAGGILISEKPLHYFTATNIPPKGFPTTQFDMIVAEDVGLYKYDILGQRGLGKIKDALTIIKQNQPEVPPIDIHNVKPLLVDNAVNRLISKGQCIGCFYVESPAMRMLLTKLEVDNYLGLVAASSIIRPGVSKSGMMREYILRHKNPERRKEAHPVMWDLMEDTYGVMVYQEDVIKVAHYFADLDLGEADVLRRGMSGKYRSREEFQKVKEKFRSNCRTKGYDDALIDEVWRQIESFAGYAFAKGHSASYAVESYQSLYLKAYYPLEYLVATLNNGGGFYRPELYVHEARKHGAQIFPPSVNYSTFETTIYGKDIYLGFQHLSSLESLAAERIVRERVENGLFHSFDDFMERVPVGITQLEILVRGNAFAFTGKDKRTLLWNAYYKINGASIQSPQKRLFHLAMRKFKLPAFTITKLENAYDYIELLGFPLCDPFDLMQDPPKSFTLARDMPGKINNTFSIYGYMVTVKNTTTSGGKRMMFGTFLDKAGEWIDTVHFPPVAARYPFRGKGIYKLYGKVVEEFGYLTLEIEKMERMPYVPHPASEVSHPKLLPKNQ